VRIKAFTRIFFFSEDGAANSEIYWPDPQDKKLKFVFIQQM